MGVLRFHELRGAIGSCGGRESRSVLGFLAHERYFIAFESSVSLALREVMVSHVLRRGSICILVTATFLILVPIRWTLKGGRDYAANPGLIQCLIETWILGETP